MKISKLFHWLYATLMLLPVVLIPVFMIYSHRHSVADGSPVAVADVQYVYKYETNEVSSLNDLVEGNIYYAPDTFSFDEIYFNDYTLEIIKCDSFYMGGTWHNGYSNPLPQRNNFGFFDILSSSIVVNVFAEESVSVNMPCYDFDNEEGIYWSFYSNLYGEDYPILEFENLYFRVLSNLSGFIRESYVSYQFNNHGIEASDYNIILSATATATIDYEDSTITNVFFNQFSDSVNNNPLISWASSSFFSAPFYYIADIFGLQHSNPICTLLSYWFSISVIWLVFDLFIYVPLLVHRWLDKASIE